MIYPTVIFYVFTQILTVVQTLTIENCLSFFEKDYKYETMELEPRFIRPSILYYDYERHISENILNIQFEFDILPVKAFGNLSIMCLGLQKATVIPEINGLQQAVLKVQTNKEVPVGAMGINMTCWVETGELVGCRTILLLTEDLINTGLFLFSPFTEKFWTSLQDEKVPYSDWLYTLNIETHQGSLSPTWLTRMNLTSLTELFVSGNVWRRPQKFLGNLPNLFRLFLMNNSIEEFPDDMLENIPQLKFLHLQVNKLTRLPSHMSNITALDISYQNGTGPVKITDEEILTLENMNSIFLNTPLKANISTFLKLPKLMYFTCHNSFVEKISHSNLPLGRNSSVYNINLASNNLSNLPTEIFRFLNKLSYLRLDSNLFKECPCIALRTVKSLTQLSLNKNKISQIPANCFTGLTSLRNLDLSANVITFIDDTAFQNTGSLLYLFIQHNNLSTISQNTFLPLKKLIRIDISYNKLKETPVLGRNSLGFVGLSHNLLTEVTNLTASVIFIQQLDLSGNHITKLRFENVARLNLSYISLSYINQDMRKYFENVSVVDLGGNMFDCCHEEIGTLRELVNSSKHRILNLGWDNPLTCVPKTGEARVILEALQDDTLCLENHSNLAMEIAVPLLVLCTCLMVFFAAGSYYKFHFSYVSYLFKIKRRGILLQDEIPAYECIYDAFVCYSNKNFQWIVQQLIPTLENGPDNYRFCIHDRDFAVGAPIDKNIVESLHKSRKVILVLTKDFLNSTWCQWEMNVASHRNFKEIKDYMILLEMEELNRGDLPSHMQHLVNSRSYIKWCQDTSDERRVQRCWRQLRDLLGDSIVKRTRKEPPRGTVLDL